MPRFCGRSRRGMLDEAKPVHSVSEQPAKFIAIDEQRSRSLIVLRRIGNGVEGLVHLLNG